MAKKFDLSTVVAVGAVAAVVGGGIVAYCNREGIRKTVESIADKLGAKEDEEGFFSVDLDEDVVIHAMDQEDAPEEGDFVDAEGHAEDAAEPTEAAAEPVEA